MKNRAACEREHDFALILSGVSELLDDADEALFKAGCDDATPCVRHGRLYLMFSRTAPSLKDAILSAIKDVRKAKIGAEVLRVDECNLVTQSEIARKIKRSRQMVHQFITGKRGPGGFPPPVCNLVDDEAPLWYWCEVADWLFENDMIRQEDLTEARQVSFINTVLEYQHEQKLDPEFTEEVIETLSVSDI